jgi:uncharacterized protein (TIRG00374 family)
LRVALAIGLICGLFVAFGSEFSDHIAAADPLLITAAAGMVLWNMVLRGWRWRTLFPKPPGLWPAVASTAASYLLNNVLPGRPGDVFRAVMLGSMTGIAKGRVLATVAFERLIDLLFASSILVVITRFKALPAWLDYGAILVGGGALCGLAAMIAFVVLWSNRTRVPYLIRIRDALPGRVRQFIARAAESFANATIDLGNLRLLVSFLLLTVVLWLGEALIVHFVFLAFGHDLGLTDSMVVLVVSAFSSLLPTVPGQIGVFEAAVVAAASALGLQQGALATAVVLHALVLFCTSGLGLVSLLIERRRLWPAA